MSTIVLYVKGGYTYFDEQDFDLISRYTWRIDANGYVVASKNGNKRLSMHRLILGLNDRNQYGDHKNHKPNDNRRCNIRAGSPADNARNRTPAGESKYLGVSYQTCFYTSPKTGELFTYRYLKAKIRVDNKLIHLGTFTNEEDAARAYNVAAKNYFGEFANLNNV